MPLSTKYIQHKKIQKAAREALESSEQLFLSGYFEAALHISSQLLAPGPWQINAYTNLVDQVSRVHLIYCWANKVDFPKVGDEPARNADELNNWAEEHIEQLFDYMVMSDRIQNAEAGRHWDNDYFARVEQMESQNGIFKEYGIFTDELDHVLKHRLRKSLNRRGPDLLPDFVKDLMPAFRTDGDIMVASQTDQFDTHTLVDILARCSEKIPHGLSYMPERCFLAVVVIDLVENNASSAVLQLKRALGGENLANVLELATWPPLRDLLKTKCLSDHLGLNDELVAGFIKKFDSRAVQEPSRNVSPTMNSYKCIDFRQFQSLVSSTDLENHESCEIEIPECDESAIAVRVNPCNALDSWKIARQLLSETGRWPVITISWSGSGDSFQDQLINDDIFMRSPYQGEGYDGNRLGLSPSALVAGAQYVQIEESLRQIADNREEPVEEFVEYELETLESTYGEAPKKNDVLDAISVNSPGAYLRLQKWLFNWQKEHEYNSPVVTGHIEWFRPHDSDPMALLLLPTPNSWEVPAYLNWYAAEAMGTEVVIAILKNWHEQYGAELVAHYGTMLQCYVSSKPTTIDKAFSLAFEQELIAPCTTALPGVSLRDHAVALMHSDQWFLHERP